MKNILCLLRLHKKVELWEGLEFNGVYCARCDYHTYSALWVWRRLLDTPTQKEAL